MEKSQKWARSCCWRSSSSRLSREVRVEEPDLRGDGFARAGVQLALASLDFDDVQTLVGGLVDQPALLRVDPLLVFGNRARHHLDLLIAGAGQLTDLCAVVFTPQLVVLGE